MTASWLTLELTFATIFPVVNHLHPKPGSYILNVAEVGRCPSSFNLIVAWVQRGGNTMHKLMKGVSWAVEKQLE